MAMRSFANPRFDADAAYTGSLASVMTPADADAARAEIASWSGYRPTPLIPMPALAGALGLDRLWCKDEGGRFGLGSFKALGGAYAVFRVLAGEVERRSGRRPASVELESGVHAGIVSGVTVATATDGNHGRSVAWGARQFGCRAVIYMHAGVSEGRERAVAALGARVERVAGTYDDSVRACAAASRAAGHHVISDTAYPGYTAIPCTVMHGYAVMVDEIVASLPGGERPTHVIVQGGCGGFAAAVCARFWQLWGRDRPRLVVVEPDNAACLYESARAGALRAVDGGLDTVMGGLACGEVSEVAWPVLDPGTLGFVTIADDWAIAAMRRLAEGRDGDPPIIAGEAGAAGVAGLLALAEDPEARRSLGLDRSARVLAFISEGATDPILYRNLVGRAPDAVGYRLSRVARSAPRR